MEENWLGLLGVLVQRASAMRSGMFLVVEDDPGTALDGWPYAQTSLSDSGWYCEVVSDRY